MNQIFENMPTVLSDMIKDYAINMRDYAVKIGPTPKHDYESGSPYVRVYIDSTHDIYTDNKAVFDLMGKDKVRLTVAIDHVAVRELITKEFFRQYFKGCTPDDRVNRFVEFHQYVQRNYSADGDNLYIYIVHGFSIFIPLQLYYEICKWIVEDYPTMHDTKVICVRWSKANGLELERPPFTDSSRRPS